ncbi:MAG: hypothetical protein AAGB03_09660, partial [Pseudomonadota bacterium]
TVARLHAFQACAFDHSATSPVPSGRQVGSPKEGWTIRIAGQIASWWHRRAGCWITPAEGLARWPLVAPDQPWKAREEGGDPRRPRPAFVGPNFRA